jgi:hypothetical protein
MPDLAKVQAVESKLVAEPAPAPEKPAAAPPDGGASGSGSAPVAPGEGAALSGPDDPGSPPREAPIDHARLRAKLEADRERRAHAARRKQAEEDAAAAKKAREEAEAEKAKWSNVGKGKSYLDTIKELGHDPAKTYEEMRTEALKAGTPEARMEAMERAFEAKIAAERTEREALAKQLEDERKATAEAQKAERARASSQAFASDFERGLRDPKFESLTEEYEPAQLFRIVHSLRANPAHLFERAEDLRVNLTHDDGSFTMSDILSVMKATQERHHARLEEQRRKKTAAAQPSPAGKQPPAATKPPTVNGTAERNAGASLGNQLAATRAADPSPRKESKEERLARLGAKYG